MGLVSLCLPSLDSLSPSLSLFLFPFVASGIMLHFSWWYWMRTSSVKLLARWEAVGSVMENDVTFHFYPPMFSLHPIWHSYAAWFECLDPNTCTPIGCFLHRLSESLRQSKRSRTILNVKWSPEFIADIFTIPVAAISCVKFDPVPQNTSWTHPLFGAYGGVISPWHRAQGLLPHDFNVFLEVYLRI